MFNQKYVKWSFLITSVLSLAACGEVGPSPSLSASSSSSASNSSSTPLASSSISSSSSSSQPPVQYTITFKNYDDSVLHTTNVIQGQTAFYAGPAPTKPATSEFTYVFTGWDKTLTNVTSAFTTKAQFSSTTNTYTITWQNHDGTVLETDTNVPYGTIPTYDGTTPIRTGSSQYSYSFTGWSPTIASVTSDVTYTAQFAQSTNAYTITWKNHDGTTLETDTNVSYGTMPTYDGATPVRTGSAQYSYTFTGWSPSIISVTRDETYIAIFSEINGTEGLIYSHKPEYGGYAVTGYSGDSQIVYVPNKYLNEDVVVLTNYSFQNNKNITKVVLPSSVWGIGTSAFHGSTSLEEIDMPNVTHIYDFAFKDAIKLKTITIPESTIHIGRSVFENCFELNSATINGLIGTSTNYIFDGASSLKKVVLNKGSISRNTLGSQGLTIESITFGANITYINNNIFSDFRFSLKKVVVNSPIIVNSSFLYYMTNVEELILGENILSVDDYSFLGLGPFQTIQRLSIYSNMDIPQDFLKQAPKLEELTFGPLVKSLGKGLCLYCSSLKVVNIAEGPKIIPSGAFFGINGLLAIVIPKSIQSIESYAFSESTSNDGKLNVFYKGTESEWNLINRLGYSNNYLKNATKSLNSNVNLVNFIETAETSYLKTDTDEIWHFSLIDSTNISFDFSSINEGTIKSIFKFHSLVEEVKLPDTIEIIHSYAFSGCIYLSSLTIPNSVTYIGQYAFSNTTSLEFIYLPQSIRFIGGFAFYNSNNLTIFSEHLSSPQYSINWNFSNRPVIWGVTIDKKIEAENYSGQFGVSFQTTTDIGGGRNAAYLETDDYLEYLVYIPKTNLYRISFRTSGNLEGGQLVVFINGIEKTLVNTPFTGGWQEWETISSDTFEIIEGVITLRIQVRKPGFNLNYFSIITESLI